MAKKQKKIYLVSTVVKAWIPASIEVKASSEAEARKRALASDIDEWDIAAFDTSDIQDELDDDTELEVTEQRTFIVHRDAHETTTVLATSEQDAIDRVLQDPDACQWEDEFSRDYRAESAGNPK